MTILPTGKLPVYWKDGFLFFKKRKDPSINDALIIDVKRIENISRYLRTSQSTNITVNSSYYPVNDLSFLKYLPFVKGISIVDDHLDVEPVNQLHELQVLGIGSFNGIIDLDNFPHLQELGISWTKQIKNIEKAEKLKWLWLDNYKDISLERLKSLCNLNFLYLYRPTIKSLTGISGMSSLVELNIDTASKLETLVPPVALPGHTFITKYSKMARE